MDVGDATVAVVKRSRNSQDANANTKTNIVFVFFLFFFSSCVQQVGPFDPTPVRCSTSESAKYPAALHARITLHRSLQS